jgi:predicted ATPase/DNA-binding SARP family transcriptional activator
MIAAPITISLLGPFRVAQGGQPVTRFTSDKERALLAYLAFDAGRPHRREALAGLLWPEMPDQVARNNLRLTLHRLRQTLNDSDDPQTAIFSIERECIQINSAACRLDVTKFNALLDQADRFTPCKPEYCPACLPCLEEAIGLYQGDLLQGFSLDESVSFSEWALLKREWLHHRAMNCMHRLAACYQRQGKDESALYYARQQLAFEPWHEEAHRQVMLILVHRGEFSAALNQFETCQQMLEQELGIPPSEETSALKERILAARSIRRHNLPVQLTSLVGREAELAQLLECLADPARRLVTVCGPGGIGKTRLALCAAEKRANAYLHGVAFAPLADIRSPDFLYSAIANALAFSPSGPRDLKKQIWGYLQDKELLLVLDSFEHLIDAGRLLTEILRAAPEVTILVTSRQRLALQSEWLIDLGGLSYLPDTSTIRGATTTDSPEEIEKFEATQLFIQRARQARPEFALSQETSEIVARICRFVEGWPLALELAAATLRTRTCAEILAEMESHLPEFESPFRDVIARHRSVWAAFDHSWRLLSPEEAQGFRKISVFRGGFSAEAAASVTSMTTDRLCDLCDKSLLVRDASGRYALHTLSQQYAGQKLEIAGKRETRKTRDRHLAYYRDLVEQARQEMIGPKLGEWLQCFETEINNLRAALEWSISGGNVEDGLRLAAILWRFWSLSGYLAEGLDWLEKLIVQSDSAPAILRAQVLRGAGSLAYNLGDLSRAASWFEACLALYREQGKQREIAAILNDLGMLATDRGHFEQAEAYYNESLACWKALRDQQGMALLLFNLGRLAYYQNDPQRTAQLCQESLALARKLGDKRILSYALFGLGSAAYRLNQIEQAHDHYLKSLALKQELGDRHTIYWPLEGLAEVAGARGQWRQALQLLGGLETLREETDISLPLMNILQQQQLLAQLHARFDVATFSQAWAEGRQMSLEQLIVAASASE